MAIRSIADSMEEGINRLDTMKNYENVMSNLGIDSEEAKKSIDRLSEALRGLPTTLDSAALSVQRLTSANGNIKASTEMFLAMNNAILAGGANAGLQASAIEQLSQAYAKGKPDMMEWRTMMMAMPAQLTQVAKVMGYINAEELGVALREGSVSMNDFMITLTKMNKESINGFKSLKEQAENATGGISTSLQNVKTALARAWANVLDAIGRENIVAFFQTIINAIDALAQHIVAFIKLIGQAVNFINNLFGKKSSKKINEVSKNSQTAASSMTSLGAGSTDAGKGMNKAAKSANKLNKELKQLAGFDEMEVLKKMEQATSGGSGTIGSSAGGVNFGDLSGIDLGDLDGEVQKTKKDIDLLAEALLGLIAGLTALKLHVAPLKSLGIGLLVFGLARAIKGLIDYLNDPSWKNFGKTIEGIGVAILGLGILIGNLPLALAGALILMIGLLATHWNEIRAKFAEFIIKLKLDGEIIRKYFGDTIANIFNYFVNTLSAAFKIMDDKMILFRKTFDDLIAFVKALADGDWRKAWQKIKDVFDDIWKQIKAAIVALPGGLALAGAISGRDFGNAFGGAIKEAVKSQINGMIALVEKGINYISKGTNNSIKLLNKIPGVELNQIKTVKLPRLAKGGIINLPSQGIPVGNAIVGERGAEGVIPLTDSQQMALLGEAIGKYITVNLTNINQMNGRIISKELKHIENENDFLFNK